MCGRGLTRRVTGMNPELHHKAALAGYDARRRTASRHTHTRRPLLRLARRLKRA